MFPYLIHKRSQSVGKCLLNIKVVRLDGSPANTRRQLVLRFFIGQGLLGIIPFLRFMDALFIFRSSHQTTHDEIADTIVVRTSDQPAGDQTLR